MSANIQRIQSYLKNCKFEPMFREEIAWNRPHGTSPTIPHRGKDYKFTLLAEKADFKVYLHFFDSSLPDERMLKQLDRELDKQAAAHLTIFVDEARENQVWLWVKRRADQPAKARVNRLTKQNSGLLLAERVAYLEVSIDEEEFLSHIGVLERVTRAFDVEKVTKTFYDAFKVQHSNFLKHVEHIMDEDDQKWYTSIMLNRLMFIYFIQKQGFLDNYSADSLAGDEDYLWNRLPIIQKKYGSDKFYAFYRRFLRRLFHEGLNTSELERASDLDEIIGRVPYLNGGLFDVHPLEEKYPDIQIKDEAFEDLFKFFDGFYWHLDDRPESKGNEINPDVLGYIFEKYINQKQMGAYYTKEDITGYIGKNTIIPFIFDTVAAEHARAFAADKPIWSLLRDRSDEYIYDALAHGALEPLPDAIEAGRADIARRTTWNQTADPLYALPTETWREVVARRDRYEEVRRLMVEGKITSINDLITYNLDIMRFARDVIAGCEEPSLLRAFYEAIRKVTVLDPTCGSGAFLFAALNILKPLYHACIERMRTIIPEYEQKQAELPASQRVQSHAIESFRATLKQIDQHWNSQEYFILKTIIVNNLYGVDIMEEAIEICKLRLFLKLVAQITRPNQLEPLPDIDFNMLAGNTLIGFTCMDEVRKVVTEKLITLGDIEETLKHIEKQAEKIERDEENFRKTQVELDIKIDPEAKRLLREELDTLHAELDHYLATEYGIDNSNIPDPAKYAAEYERWQKNYHPFHWWAKFHGIMNNGGFDVIIGNPPYVEYEKVTKDYKLLSYQTLPCGNLYALIMERCVPLLVADGRFGMIVPASASCTDRYIPLQKILLEQSALHIASFSDQRGKLFDIPHPRLCIISYQKSIDAKRVFATAYMKLVKELRTYLFERLGYTEVTNLTKPGVIPRYSSGIERTIHAKLLNQTHHIGSYLSRFGNNKVYYTRKISWFVQVTPFIPSIMDGQGQIRNPSELKTLQLSSPEYAEFAFAALNSNLFYWFITIGSDCRNLNMREVLGLPFDMSRVLESTQAELKQLSATLAEGLQEYSEYRKMSFKNIGTLIIQCIFPSRSKPIIDEIDRVLAQHYGFTDEELDFIINYDIKYRMGRENGEESEE
jgi:hypothetical protein